MSQQLSQLYGPLYSLVTTNSPAYAVFQKTFRNGHTKYDHADPWTEDEENVWKVWAENVFIPSNLRIKTVIEDNAHLVLDGVMPDVFIDMLAHLESSKIVLPASRQGAMKMGPTMEALDQFARWPEGFNGYVHESYVRVADEYARLIGRSRGKHLMARVQKR